MGRQQDVSPGQIRKLVSGPSQFDIIQIYYVYCSMRDLIRLKITLTFFVKVVWLSGVELSSHSSASLNLILYVSPLNKNHSLVFLAHIIL